MKFKSLDKVDPKDHSLSHLRTTYIYTNCIWPGEYWNIYNNVTLALRTKSGGVPGLTVCLRTPSWCEWMSVSSRSSTSVFLLTMSDTQQKPYTHQHQSTKPLISIGYIWAQNWFRALAVDIPISYAHKWISTRPCCYLYYACCNYNKFVKRYSFYLTQTNSCNLQALKPHLFFIRIWTLILELK